MSIPNIRPTELEAEYASMQLLWSVQAMEKLCLKDREAVLRVLEIMEESSDHLVAMICAVKDRSHVKH
jgi:hypothetical protein